MDIFRSFADLFSENATSELLIIVAIAVAVSLPGIVRDVKRGVEDHQNGHPKTARYWPTWEQFKRYISKYLLLFVLIFVLSWGYYSLVGSG